jgi:hypothetical protein
MPRLRRSLLTVTLALAAGGCIQPVIPGVRGLEPETPRPAPGERPTDGRPAFRPKRVAQKEPPATLIAKDGSWCTVGEDRYRMIKIDDSVWCGWTGTNR